MTDKGEKRIALNDAIHDYAIAIRQNSINEVFDYLGLAYAQRKEETPEQILRDAAKEFKYQYPDSHFDFENEKFVTKRVTFE